MNFATACALLSQVNNLEKSQLIELCGYLQELARESISIKKRAVEAVTMLQDMIDGGEECKGRDSEISNVIRKLEWGK